jgi:RHH-type proline utilization regulon transcriptional repressor/proline dehydrogenase/delta 1-pyrroline-5-carboxylate dehydrogenase
VVQETFSQFISSLQSNKDTYLRLCSPPDPQICLAAAESFSAIVCDPPLACGPYELLCHLREVAISYDYHRYGNLGEREGEKRRAVL